MKKQLGFTIIEMLVVMGIVGIAVGIGVTFLGNNSRRSVTQAQARFSSDINRVRTLVQRYNVSYELNIASDKKSYTLTPKNTVNTTVANVPVITGAFSDGITIKTLSTATFPAKIYSAPFGRFGDGGTPACFEMVGNEDYRAVISLVGVTGKVISRNVVKSTTSGCS